MGQTLIAYGVATFVALFPIANPIGAVPLFYSLTAVDSPAYRQEQARWTALNTTGVLMVFLLGGKFILDFFGISLGVLRIAGGLIVGHTAWEMVTARERLSAGESTEAADKADISFTPMAVPMLSGPGAIGITIGLAERATQWSDYLGCLAGIAGLGLSVYLSLVLGEPLIKMLGKTGVGALNRVLGFLTLAIAVQFVAEGVFTLLTKWMPSMMR